MLLFVQIVRIHGGCIWGYRRWTVAERVSCLFVCFFFFSFLFFFFCQCHDLKYRLVRQLIREAQSTKYRMQTVKMLSLPIVVAISVGCSALLIVGAILGVAVWWRKRQDRLSLAVAQAHHRAAQQGQQSCGSFMTDSPLNSPTYPYSIRQEWAPLGSQETFQRPTSQLQLPSSPLKKEKSKSLRRSISKSLSKSLSVGKHSQKPIDMEPLPNLQPGPQKTVFPIHPDAKEKEPKSAIAGFSELPTETTPRHTPERERNYISPLQINKNRPDSTAWPLLHSEQRLSAVASGQPSYFEQDHGRLRSGSIATQSAGAAPNMPMPPTPLQMGQSYQFSREDSLMGMSSLSLETANSSILDDNLRRSMSVDRDFNYSPSLPPCPTFTPFSPCDIVIGGSVAQDCTSHQRMRSQRLSSSTAHLTSASMDSSRHGTPPRRSLTTREVSPQPPNWANRLPRRSETVISSPSSTDRCGSRPASNLSVNSLPAFLQSGQGLYSRQEFGSQSHRQERYSMYEKSQDKERPCMVFSQSLGEQPRSNQTPSPGSTRESLARNSLPSAMKSSQTGKRGHRRQNCVRISIHPPMTFGGPAFSPMLEEPEEVLDLGNSLMMPDRKRDANESPSSANKRDSYAGSREQRTKRHSRHRSTGSIVETASVLNSVSPGANSRVPRLQLSRKRPRSATDQAEDVFTSENQVTVIPSRALCRSSDESHLLKTPSPDRPEPVWTFPRSDEFFGTPKLPANASTGSPRRPVPNGPRNQPPRRKNEKDLPVLTLNTTKSPSPARDSPTRNGVARAHTLAASPTKDVRKSITLLRRMNSEAYDEDSKSYRRMGRTASISRPNDKNIRTPPSNRNSVLSNDSLTIWEDASEDDITTTPTIRPKNPPPFKLLERIDSEGTVEDNLDIAVNNHKPLSIRRVPPSSSVVSMGSQDRSNNNDDTDDVSPKRIQHGSAWQTPNSKKSGCTSAAATPGSLYDRDGFFKEQKLGQG